MAALLVATLPGLAGTAGATGLLTSPTSSYSYSGALAGNAGGAVAPSSFNVPIVVSGQSLPFVQHTTQSDQWGMATSRYDLQLNSVLYPAFDTLTLQLQVGVSGQVSGSWDTWSGWTNNLDGTLATEFQIPQWSTLDIDLSVVWSLVRSGSAPVGGAYADINLITIRGPLETNRASQTVYLLEKSLAISPNQQVGGTVSSHTLHNVVPGKYEAVIHSQMNSGGNRSGSQSLSIGIDIGNNASLKVTQTISPTACLPGVPCPSAANLAGAAGVTIQDFAAWYAGPVDVTSDGQVGSADVAAMAYLTGVSSADSNGNGIVDAVDAYLAIAPVGPTPSATAAVQLHPAHPNPFNPVTTLSYTLPTETSVNLSVFDVQGRLLRTLVADEVRAAGRHEVNWNGSDQADRVAPAGVYVYRLRAGAQVLTGSMLLLK